MFRSLAWKTTTSSRRHKPQVHLELQQLESRDLPSLSPLAPILPGEGSAGSLNSGNIGTFAIIPITFTNPGPQNNSEGDLVLLQIQARDVNNNPLTYSATGLPTGLGIDPNTGLISGTITTGSSAFQSFSPTIVASDGSASGPMTFTWNVNDPITLTNPGIQFNNEGDQIVVPVHGRDSNGNTLTFSAVGLPAGLTIDPGNGLISGTLAPGSSANGPVTTIVSASDGSASNQITFVWYIGTPVLFFGMADQFNNEGDAVNLQVSAFDINGQTLTYSAAGLPPGLAIDPNSGLITGTIATGNSAYQVFSSTVIASDGNANGQLTFHWYVNDPITIASIPNQNSTDGDTVSLQVQASDANGGSLTYSATGLPNGLTIDPNTGLISGNLAVGGSVYRYFFPTVTASDGTAQYSLTFTWNVWEGINIIPPGGQFSSEGDTVSLQIQASDPSPGTLTYSATGLPNGLTIDPNSGLISGTVSADNAVDLPIISKVTVSDGVASAQTSIYWFLQSPISMNLVGNQLNNDGDTVNLPIQASDATGGTLTYSAMGLPTGLAIDPATGLISGTIATGSLAYQNFTTTVTASDGVGGDQQTFTWYVNDAITIANPGDQSSFEGDVVTLPIQASAASGNPLTYGANGLPPGLTIASKTGIITGTLAPAVRPTDLFKPR